VYPTPKSQPGQGQEPGKIDWLAEIADFEYIYKRSPLDLTLLQFDEYRIRSSYIMAMESGDEKAITKARLLASLRNQDGS
jgi:hypothetical protein